LAAKQSTGLQQEVAFTESLHFKAKSKFGSLLSSNRIYPMLMSITRSFHCRPMTRKTIQSGKI